MPVLLTTLNDCLFMTKPCLDGQHSSLADTLPQEPSTYSSTLFFTIAAHTTRLSTGPRVTWELELPWLQQARIDYPKNYECTLHCLYVHKLTTVDICTIPPDTNRAGGSVLREPHQRLAAETSTQTKMVFIKIRGQPPAEAGAGGEG